MKEGTLGKHGKRKSTLLKEQIIREYTEKMLSRIDNMADIQNELATIKYNKKHPNSKLLDVKLRATEIITERVLGKAKASVEMEVTLPVPIYGGSENSK